MPISSALDTFIRQIYLFFPCEHTYCQFFHVVYWILYTCIRWIATLYEFVNHDMQLATPEQKTAIVGVLGQVHISDATEEDLKAGKEEIKVNLP